MTCNNTENSWIQWNSIVMQPHIKCQYIWFYTTLVIEVVFNHRCSAILVMKIMPRLNLPAEIYAPVARVIIQLDWLYTFQFRQCLNIYWSSAWRNCSTNTQRYLRQATIKMECIDKSTRDNISRWGKSWSNWRLKYYGFTTITKIDQRLTSRCIGLCFI